MTEAGTVIDGKYEILTQIGQGGMSVVYLAMDKRLNKQWAVKEIKREARDADNAIVVQSILAEANLMKKLDHPALPRIVDIIEDRQTIYIVMDYIEGETLSKILKEYGPQPEEQVIEWAKQLCEVLDYLHTRKPPIIYRDMKPSNVMLKPDGNIKVIDFGIAREYKENNIQDTVSLGTKGYAAPEQFGGRGQTDVRTDVYGLGVTLYHLVTGKNPCEEPYELYPIRQWNPALSGGLEKIIIKCTRPAPKDRYQSCAEVLYALEHYKEIDDVYRKAEKKKLRLFLASCFLSVAGLFVGAASGYYADRTNNMNYDTMLATAEKTTDYETKTEIYYEAIEIKPGDVRAYEGLINTYKDDAVFTVEEERQLIESVTMNIEELKKNEDYMELSFEIGKIYWYYYDYESFGESTDNQVVRMKASIQWFKEAAGDGLEDVEYNSSAVQTNMARVYAKIGEFNRDISRNVAEAADKGTYAEYWNSIKEINDLVKANEESEIVKLEVYKLTIVAIETYSNKFSSDGVEEKDLYEQFNSVEAAVKNIQTSSDKTEEMKAYILERLDEASQAIKTAYQK